MKIKIVMWSQVNQLICEEDEQILRWSILVFFAWRHFEYHQIWGEEDEKEEGAEQILKS